MRICNLYQHGTLVVDPRQQWLMRTLPDAATMLQILLCKHAVRLGLKIAMLLGVC